MLRTWASPGRARRLAIPRRPAQTIAWRPKDLAQISFNYTGKRLIAQGYRLPSISVNLGYRHQIRPGLAAVFTVADVFDLLRERTVLDTATLHETATRRRSSRTGNVALAWTIGSKREAPAAKFDYSE